MSYFLVTSLLTEHKLVLMSSSEKKKGNLVMKEKVDLEFIILKSLDLTQKLEVTSFSIDSDSDIHLKVDYIHTNYTDEIISDLKQVIEFLEKYQVNGGN